MGLIEPSKSSDTLFRVDSCMSNSMMCDEYDFTVRFKKTTTNALNKEIPSGDCMCTNTDIDKLQSLDSSQCTTECTKTYSTGVVDRVCGGQNTGLVFRKFFKTKLESNSTQVREVPSIRKIPVPIYGGDTNIFIKIPDSGLTFDKPYKLWFFTADKYPHINQLAPLTKTEISFKANRIKRFAKGVR